MKKRRTEDKTNKKNRKGGKGSDDGGIVLGKRTEWLKQEKQRRKLKIDEQEKREGRKGKLIIVV